MSKAVNEEIIVADQDSAQLKQTILTSEESPLGG